jgi:excisionase family DNA binding protein
VTASPLTYREAARQLSVSERTARRLAASGHLDKIRVAPNAVRIRPESVARLLQHGYSAPQLQEAS